MLFPWSISLFPKGFFNIAPAVASVKSKTDIQQLFNKPSTRNPKFPKKNLPCWSPALYLPGTTRANKNVESVTALVYDLDHPKKQPRSMAQELRGRNVAFIIYTTWSHRPSAPRYRLILFLSRPLTPQEYPSAWAKGLTYIGYDAGVDRVARDVSRHYALPAQVDGEEYVSETHIEGQVLDADELSKTSQDAPTPTKGKLRGKSVLPNFKILLDSGELVEVGKLKEQGEGKHKCTCPFQDDASPGSAFFRVCANGQAFIYCTSERHAHEAKQFYVRAKKDPNKTSRTAEDREEWLKEIPKELKEQIERRIAYNATQGVFYRHFEGAWQISSPMRKEHLMDHLIGLMSGKCGKTHAQALIDHVLSRQVYGFECRSVKDRIVRRNEVPMLNLYAFPTLEPVRGPCPRVKEILRLLCQEDKESLEWILHWSAALIQHPERRAMVAVLVLSQQQGIGKSLYGRLLASIIGEGNSTVVSNKALKDSFNSHYVTKLLVLADEVAVNRSAGNTMAEVKAAITDDRVHCAAPYAPRITVLNRMSWWLTSNRLDPVLIEKDDRRFTVLASGKATPKYRQMLRNCFDPKTSVYSASFYEEIQAFAHHLHSMTIDWSLISRPVVTRARQELQTITADSLDAFCQELRARGVTPLLTNYPPGPNYPRYGDVSDGKVVPTDTLYGTYREWCDRLGRRDPKPEPMFRAAIESLDGTSVGNAHVGGRRLTVYTGLSGHKSRPKGKVVSLHPQD